MPSDPIILDKMPTLDLVSALKRAEVLINKGDISPNDVLVVALKRILKERTSAAGPLSA